MNAIRLQERTGTSRSVNKRLRREGKVPGVVYGAGGTPRTIAVEERDLQEWLKSGRKIMQAEIPGQGEASIMLQELQRDPLKRDIVHLDLLLVNPNQRIKSQVRLDYTGEAPGVRQGGLLQIQLHEVTVRGLPDSIPASLQVDLGTLEIGAHLLAADLALPAGLELRTDPEDVLVTVLMAQKEPETEEPSTEAAAQASGKEREAANA